MDGGCEKPLAELRYGKKLPSPCLGMAGNSLHPGCWLLRLSLLLYFLSTVEPLAIQEKEILGLANGTVAQDWLILGEYTL